ncbi:indole-3-glycerol phosphate synthase [Fructobacillus pseudoficulneus]|uniref:Indole-3-glycerol phosphate synthase n=1 Tax=Fructobacillus pseudoficulneus TaxID=220714 RepID=A0A3F3GW17_9LACO|nr:indole-3-glycerol phosphate synthase TrpC [Fructobacillus pseudoficulneus]GAP02497.1 indole-3-glycerol phosphate synthase [Fructobacillus pseudoficulneus]SEH37271.1 indole-3-glycerol phosphate synthase [Fructobacillus pseudoficulneus]
MILDDLVAATQKRLAKEKQQVSQTALVDRIKDLPVGQAEAIYQEFLAPGLHLIGELKQASPSKGQIVTDFPYQAIAAEYEQIGLTAISVLTESDYFLGDIAYLEDVAKQQDLPVLRKDFIIDEYMIYQAKVAGAKIILLIVAILTPVQLQEYLQLAHQLGLAVLVEAYDESEIQQALRVGAQMIGVNNRNLKDFSVSFENSLNLRQLVPETVAFIAESGVQSPTDVRKLRKIGVNGVLIGEALMTATNRRAFVQEALAESTVVGTGHDQD